MENFTRIKKIGKGTYGDVLLVERKSDNLVQQFHILLAVCCEASGPLKSSYLN